MGIIGSKIIRLDRVDSTNTYLKRIAHHTPEGTLVIAQEQTAGRGRRGRKWIGSRGKSLFMSFLVSPFIDSRFVPLFMLWPSVAVVETLEKFHVKADVKWPNDVLINGKKIGGVLVDAITQKGKTKLVVGIGLNLNQSAADFAELSEKAGSIKSESGITITVDALLTALPARLDQGYLFLQKGDIKFVQQKWLQICCHLNKPVTIFTNDAPLSGLFAGVDEYGFALVNDGRQLRRITNYTKVILREEHAADD